MAGSAIIIPSGEEIEKLDIYEKLFNSDSAAALKWIYQLQRWKADEIERRIPGVKASTWRAYGQQNKSSNKLLHVVAAFSWLSQITMTAMYHGKRIQSFWPGVNETTIETIVFSSLLPTNQFDYLICQLIEKIKSKGYQHTDSIAKQLQNINKYNDSEFLIPYRLGIDEFKYDYYRSIAINLVRFRIANKLSVGTMASVLNTTSRRYRSFEDVDNPVGIPLFFAMRLKLGFQLENTVPFTDQMKEFSAFTSARNIQQLREQLIIELMSPVNDQLQLTLKSLSYHVMRFYTQ